MLRYQTLKEVQHDFPSVVGFRYVVKKYGGYYKKHLQFSASCPQKLQGCTYPFYPRWVGAGTYNQTSGACKSCGFRKNGNILTLEQLRMINAISICQFPGCPETKDLAKDHAHNLRECEHTQFGGGYTRSRKNGIIHWRLCKLCFRGILCRLHNAAMAVVDKHPELYLGTREGEWINRRPFREEKWDIFT